VAEYGSLSFAEQIAYFKGKLNLPTARWDDIRGAAHDRAFIVAGAAKADLLADLHTAVLKGIEDGTTLEEFRRDFDEIVAKHGWTGWTGEDSVPGVAWRTRVIYETNLRTSYAAGRWAQIKEVKAERPYLQYRHNDSVLHPRPLHKSWDGLVLAVDDPWWRTHWPPNGWGCKCRAFALSARDLAKMGKTGPDKTPNDGTYTVTRRGEEQILPKGVDYGWDHAPGANRYELDQMLLDPKLMRLFGSVPPAAIAHGAESDAIAGVLRDVAGTFGEPLPPFTRVTEVVTAKYKMATDCNGVYMVPGPGNPLAHYTDRLKAALWKIRMGRGLEPEEESMIKTIWHEIGHNRQQGLKDKNYVYAKDSVNETLLEATNEFIALRTYPQFLRAIGGGAARFPVYVRADSGYRVFVDRIEALLRAVAVEQDEFLEEMERVSFEGPIDDGHGGTILANLSDAIAKAGRAAGWKGLSRTQIQSVLQWIQKPDDFAEKLGRLKARSPHAAADSSAP
jgi:hypothetical protein